jgi:hypothetical protein
MQQVSLAAKSDYRYRLAKMRFPLSLYFELLSLLFAIIFYSKLLLFRLKPFLLLLIVICITEACGANMRLFNLHRNYFMYNIYYVISMPIHFWIFINMLDYKGRVKTGYILIAALVMCFLIVNVFFLHNIQEFNVYSIVMVEFIKGVLSLMVITMILKEDESEMSIGNNPYFWIAGATLIFSVSAVILFGLQKFIVTNKIQINGKSIYRIIIPLVNVVLYSSYCYAFYLCRKLTRKLSLQ